MPHSSAPATPKRRANTPTDTDFAIAAMAEQDASAADIGRPKRASPKAPAAVDEVVKPAKTPKAKLVRDSFTIPKDEYQTLEALKGRALGLEVHVKKSELLRAGIQALKLMSDRAFLKAVGNVPTLKTGRPKSE